MTEDCLTGEERKRHSGAYEDKVSALLLNVANELISRRDFSARPSTPFPYTVLFV